MSSSKEYIGSTATSLASSAASSSQNLPLSVRSDICFVDEGRGGTFTFSGASSSSSTPKGNSMGSFKYIGTEGCVSCVGVYFQVDQTRCFCAHIDAALNQDFQEAPNPDQFKEMKDQISGRLKEHANGQGWDPKTIIKDTLIIVCPFPDRPGSAAIAAVQEFLGMKGSTVHSDKHGFTVEPSSTGSLSVKLLAHRFVKPERILDLNFTKRAAGLKKDEWRYTCGKGWGKSRPSSAERSDRGGSRSDGDINLEMWLAGSGSEWEKE